MPAAEAKPVIVIGAGLAGLTTALQLQAAGFTVKLVAQVFPTDPSPPRWMTWSSNAWFSSISSDQSQEYLDAEARSMESLQETMGDIAGLLEFTHNEYLSDLAPASVETKPHIKTKPIAKESLPSGLQSGVSFRSISIDVITTLRDLWLIFQRKGGQVYRGTVRHIREILETGVSTFQRTEKTSPEDDTRPLAVFVCVGLGARYLGGVEDTEVFPRRIQLPIPRPSLLNDVLSKALRVCPELVRETRGDTATIDDVKAILVRQTCDLYAERRGGLRLELEKKESTIVVFNYGHGVNEVQGCWAAATRACVLLKEALNALQSSEASNSMEQAADKTPTTVTQPSESNTISSPSDHTCPSATNAKVLSDSADTSMISTPPCEDTPKSPGGSEDVQMPDASTSSGTSAGNPGP
ncbi:D-amino-acid oxidase [Coprinopsis cinerea AmutBmut pab1-1]|nr:D-amino-acid oxidase [Coprinopsis cinerea AmutBmut pab1-1]